MENFPFVIDDQVQFEAEEPSHGTFSMFYKSLKSFMNQYALVSAYAQRSGIQETNSGTTTQ